MFIFVALDAKAKKSGPTRSAEMAPLQAAIVLGLE